MFDSDQFDSDFSFNKFIPVDSKVYQGKIANFIMNFEEPDFLKKWCMNNWGVPTEAIEAEFLTIGGDTIFVFTSVYYPAYRFFFKYIINLSLYKFSNKF